MCDDPDQILKDSIMEICNVANLVRNQLFKFNSFVEKTLNDSTNLNQDFNQVQAQLVNLINNIDSKIEKCQNDITMSKEKIDLCQELLDATELQFNRVRLGRTSAYSDQIQNFRHQNTTVALKYLHGHDVDPSFFEEANPNSQNYIMVLPYAHGGDLLNYVKKRWNRMKWVNKLHILRHLTYGIVDIHNKEVKKWITEVENPPSEIAQQFEDDITSLDQDISENSITKSGSQDLSRISENLSNYYSKKCGDSFRSLTLSPHSTSSENSMLSVEKEAETSIIGNSESVVESENEYHIGFYSYKFVQVDDDVWNSVQERDFLSWLTKFDVLEDYSSSDIGTLFKRKN
ncbi:18865_t:CDS:2 [Gigaspora rosea]|nr:18865_t:CDS:2 [Gigaspora rosea]